MDRGEEPAPKTEEQNRESRLNPDGAQTIISHLKDVRSRILRELYHNGGEASVTQLRSETGANVPDNSLNHHLTWLRGEKDFDWWSGDFPALVETVRREDHGYGEPVRIIGLTDAGGDVIDKSRAGVIVTPNASVEEIRSAVQGHGSQIHQLAENIDEIKSKMEKDGSSEDDSGGNIEDRVEEIESNVEENREWISKTLDNVEHIQDQLGVEKIGSDI